MFPNNILSVIPQPAPFLSPDNIDPSPLYSWQRGGIALSNNSQGMLVQDWYLEIVGTSQAVISSATQLPLVLLTETNLESVSLAFDQNMKPCIALQAAGNAGFWWYDAIVPGYVFLTLPPGTQAPQVTLDDKRKFSIQQGLSDVILTYINNNDLFFRMLRDRYTIEYSLYTNISGGLQIIAPYLNKVGMANNFRLQWMISGSFYG